MKEIVKNVYHVGDSGCSVYLVNTNSKEGLVLIDCGMSLDMIKKISKLNLNPKNIKHSILTHFHIDIKHCILMFTVYVKRTNLIVVVV